jgi:hypothetical protein
MTTASALGRTEDGFVMTWIVAGRKRGYAEFVFECRASRKEA